MTDTWDDNEREELVGFGWDQLSDASADDTYGDSTVGDTWDDQYLDGTKPETVDNSLNKELGLAAEGSDDDGEAEDDERLEVNWVLDFMDSTGMHHGLFAEAVLAAIEVGSLDEAYVLPALDKFSKQMEAFLLLFDATQDEMEEPEIVFVPHGLLDEYWGDLLDQVLKFPDDRSAPGWSMVIMNSSSAGARRAGLPYVKPTHIELLATQWGRLIRDGRPLNAKELAALVKVDAPASPVSC